MLIPELVDEIKFVKVQYCLGVPHWNDNRVRKIQQRGCNSHMNFDQDSRYSE